MIKPDYYPMNGISTGVNTCKKPKLYRMIYFDKENSPMLKFKIPLVYVR